METAANIFISVQGQRFCSERTESVNSKENHDERPRNKIKEKMRTRIDPENNQTFTCEFNKEQMKELQRSSST